MTTQAQVVTTQVQAMTTQANWEVVPRVNQNASTMDSCLRDFTRMKPPMFYRSMVNEDPQDFLDQVYKILYAMGLSYNDIFELASYKLKDVSQTWYT